MTPEEVELLSELTIVIPTYNRPLELERANMFPDNFTQINGITTKKVGFLMGNALVIGIVEKVRKCILQYELNSYP